MKENTPDILTQQQEILCEIGSLLQQTRESKGLTFKAISRKTNIRSALLKSMENGEMERLPEPVYVRGLLQRYAESLGLNGQAIADQFPVENGRPNWKFPSLRSLSLQFNLRPVHLYVVYLVIIVTTVQSLSNVLKRPSIALNPELQESVEPVSQDNEATPAPTVSQPSAAEQAPGAELVSTDEKETLIVDVEIQDEAWVEVEVDGEKTFAGTLSKGTQQKWEIDESITIKTGNAGGVFIKIENENQAPEPLGEPGAVEEFTFQALAEDGEESPRSTS